VCVQEIKMGESKYKTPASRGRKGGQATVRKHGKEHMKKISKLGVEAHWGSKRS